MLVTGIFVVLAAAAALILEPSVGSHPTANRAKCASNLHQIGLGILLFSQDHGGRYPDSLAELTTAVQIASDTLICPSSNDEAAVFPSSLPTTREAAAALAVPGHLSYTYVGRGLTAVIVTDTTVIAYEPLGNHDGEGCNVLYGDGHVQWVDAKHAAMLPTTAAATTSAGSVGGRP